MLLRKIMRPTAMLGRLALLLLAVGGLVLPAAGAASHAAERDDIIGTPGMHMIAGEETLLDVARDNGLGFVELLAANPGVDPWLPGVGRWVNLPTGHILPDAPRQGIVVNLGDLRLYYYPPGGKPPQSVPIGVGRDGLMTPLGTTKVIRKRVNPTWIPTPATRRDKPYLPARVGPGPDNPLGAYALYLGWPTYLIHGTNNPWAIGRRVSRGCIRLYPEDIARLFAEVPVGTPVTVVNQPVKVGWRGGTLYLEVHPSPSQVDQIEQTGSFSWEPVKNLVRRIIDATKKRQVKIDWAAVDRAVAERQGTLVRISR